MLEEQRSILSVLKVKLKEAQRTEGRVSSNSDAFLLGVVHQTGLGEVGVVFDLEGGGTDAGVAEQIHQQLGTEVADADAASQLLVNEGLHCAPGLVDGGVGELDLALGCGPAGRVAH